MLKNAPLMPGGIGTAGIDMHHASMHHALVYLVDQQKATEKYVSQLASFHAVIKRSTRGLPAPYPRVKHG